jgi:AcrR family transcriptional regulator
MNARGVQAASPGDLDDVKPQPALNATNAEDAVDAGAGADTPAERRKRKVRDAIIEAAEDVFALEGEAGLSMRRLADKIDYSPAAIYKYFSSKDELLAEIREQFFERLSARMEASGAAGAWDIQLFRASLMAYIQTGLDNPNHYRMAFGNIGESPPREGTRAYESMTTWNAFIEELVANGSFRAVDPGLASKSIWASIHGLTLLLASIPHFHADPDGTETCTQGQLIDFHVEQVCRGLASGAR